MEFNRNHYFMAGLVVLLLGIQLRMVESYVLNENASRYFHGRAGGMVGLTQRTTDYLPAFGPTPRKVIRPPEWLGWALMSIGSVLILHSLALNRPSG